ncbi:hypothetical protein D3C72_2551120 [compost metagenome]
MVLRNLDGRVVRAGDGVYPFQLAIFQLAYLLSPIRSLFNNIPDVEVACYNKGIFIARVIGGIFAV